MQLNRKFYLHANDKEWDEIMVSLAAAGIVLIEQKGAMIIYIMPPNMVLELGKHFAGKQ